MILEWFKARFRTSPPRVYEFILMRHADRDDRQRAALQITAATRQILPWCGERQPVIVAIRLDEASVTTAEVLAAELSQAKQHGSDYSTYAYGYQMAELVSLATLI